MDNTEALCKCVISKEKNLLQKDKIFDMLKKTYWGQNRSEETVLKSIENSICYGVYLNNIQIGFARIITDYATAYYLCDLIIDELYRGKGIGKKLIETIINEEPCNSLFGMLITKDAHSLYEQYGFKKNGDIFMFKFL